MRRLYLLVVAALLFFLPAAPQTPSAQISVSLTPSSTSVGAGKSTTFEATVHGTNLPGVMWSVVPPIGTLSVSQATSSWDAASATPVSTMKATYTAPATIDGPQAVTLVAMSYADSSKTASATVWLTSAVAIALTPSSASVSAGNSVRFTPSIAGSLNAGVSWSLSPAVGTITDGLYTAPVNIDTLQTILVTAMSLADPSKLAQSSITLMPSRPLSISISPAQTTLEPGQSKQFTATIQGGSANVWWAISPMVGTISPSGLYTPPSSVTDGQVITVKAGISSDPTKTATAQVTLAAPTPPPPLPPVQLPIEMIGPDGMTSTISFNIPQGSNLSGPIKLLMKIHGLRSQTQASVQINSSGWIPINNSTITVLGNGAAYGGIGGGFSTLQMTIPVPLTSINIGANMLSFRFNGTDGRVSGFRVLSFNFLAGDGSALMPDAAFVYDDPNTWQPPSSQTSDIAAGKTLWYTAPLTVPTQNGPAPIQARCTDCHAQDGRDLKYFNYSNNSVRARSIFHGLTAQQGDQIASYIRSLSVPNPGRPWNPPYQPGPGMDAQPLSNWAAGAGLDAVLTNDLDMAPYLMPGGSTAGWDGTKYLNARELPVALQLPDWNSWLPGIHPMDAFGPAFTSLGVNSLYQKMRSSLVLNSPTAYRNGIGDISNFIIAADQKFLAPIELQTTNWDLNDMRNKVYSAALWKLVKLWEVNQEFGLEGMPQVPFGATAELRAWYANPAFNTSPNILHIPAGAGLGNGSVVSQRYLALVWYLLQMVINDGNGKQVGGSPMDYPYVFGFIKDLSIFSNNSPEAYLLLTWFIKALQEETQTGVGPEMNSAGWSPNATTPEQLVHHDWQPSWSGVSPQTRATLMQAVLQNWFTIISQFTPQQFYQGNWANPADDPRTLDGLTSWGGEVWNMLPRFRYYGVDASLTIQIANWAAAIWPLGNWSLNQTATCGLQPGTNTVRCTSD